MHAHEFWTDRLSEALDGTLPPEQAEGLEEHLSACPACRAVRDELGEVRRRARSLGVTPPETDLWARIAPALDEERAAKIIPMHAGTASTTAVAEGGRGSRRRFALSPLPAAAAVVLLLGAGAVGGALLTRSQASPSMTPVTAAAEEPDEIRMAAEGTVAPSLFAELRTLEAALRTDLGRLDPETRTVILTNLETIDRAIRESVGALRADPESRYLQGHLGSALQRKVGYLQSVTRLLES